MKPTQDEQVQIESSQVGSTFYSRNMLNQIRYAQVELASLLVRARVIYLSVYYRSKSVENPPRLSHKRCPS